MQLGDLDDWLNGLGLGALVPIFRAQGIDSDILADLTESDLHLLGVPMGPRKKLLKALAALHDPTHSPDPGKPATNPPPRLGAERRNLTLLFCDMVGSTNLATRLDPEELRAILNRYMDSCTAVIERLGGYVASFHGDGLMAFFGYPQAREDAAERAVRAGLQLIEAVAAVPAIPGAPLQARIGIATGLAVVGDLIGEGSDRENGVVGQPPALAVRLQAAAPPSGIVISQATHDLLGGLFTLEPLGALSLKGFDQPQFAWQVIGAARSESRFAAAHRSRRTPMLGRRAELSLLLDRWGRAGTGEGQTVILTGEPGLGKSRIIAALRETLLAPPFDLQQRDMLILQCASYSQTSALRPVIDWVERRAGFTPEDTPSIRRSRLDAFVGPNGPARPILAELLGLDAVVIPADQTARRERVLAALVALFADAATARPRLLVFEDAHWSDTVTLELVGRIVAAAADLPVMILVSTRPELVLPWSDRATTISLDRLDPSASAEIIERLGAGGLPPDIRARINERAGGVPLFVEELTRAVLEGDAETLTVPATLQDTLMARLDRLGPAKAIAQTGAVLGRQFPYSWLAACAGVAEAPLARTLDDLLRSGLMVGRGLVPDATFSFRHALIQDAAYQSILRTERMRLHDNIATVLAQRFPRIADEQPEVIAHHHTEAGNADTALDWWQRASVRAIGQAAWGEAVQHLQAALRLLTALPDATREPREIALRRAMMTPLVSLGGYTTAEAASNIDRLSQLLEHAPPGLDGVVLLYSEAARLLLGSQLDRAEALARRTLQIAQRTAIPNLPFLPQRIIGYSALIRGQFAQADYWFATSAQEYDPAINRDIRPGSPHDPYASLMAQDVLLLIQQGRLDQAEARGQAALAEADRLASPTTQAYVLSHLGLACLVRDDPQAARPIAAALAIAVERAAWLKPNADCLIGWLEAIDGDLDAGLARMRKGGDLARHNQSDIWAPLYILTEAALLERHHQLEAALDRLDTCEASVTALGQAYVLAEVHRRRGVIHRAMGDARAEAELRTALHIAQRQGAGFYALRAAVDLAASIDSDHAALDALLAPILAGFTPASDHPALRRARGLLREAASAETCHAPLDDRVVLD